jgi:hypothetical protein
MVLFTQRLTYLLDSVSNADVNHKLCPWQSHTWHNRPNGWSMLEKATMSSIIEGNRRQIGWKQHNVICQGFCTRETSLNISSASTWARNPSFCNEHKMVIAILYHQLGLGKILQERHCQLQLWQTLPGSK